MAVRIADSRGARKRFGFGGAPDDPITNSPKYTDQWYIEFTDTNDTVKDISAQAQSVSPIVIQTTTQPVDRYGRREYIPTRVDFPEVTVTLYDTVDGKTMVFVQEIYEQFFKNASLSVGAGVSTIEDINSGRKLPTTTKTESHKNFDKVTIYHFFGSFAGGKGNGTVQRIVLINPVVTSITFSESDYSQSGLKTITLTLQPENIIFGTPTDAPSVPTWVQDGERFDSQSLNVDNSEANKTRLENELGVNKLANMQGRDLSNGFSGQTLDTNQKRRAMTDDEKQRLRELQRSKNALDATNKDPNATQEEKDAALERWQEAKRNSPIVSVNPETKLNVENSSQVRIPEKDTSLSAQKRTASKISQNATKSSDTAPKIDTAPPSDNTRSYNESYSGRNIGGEPYIPGKPMSEIQIAAIDTSLSMGNPTPPDSVMADYNAGVRLREQRAAAAQSDLENPGISSRMTEEERSEAERQARQDNIQNIKKQRGPQ